MSNYISKFIVKELEVFRRECNFTNEELDFFDLRAQDMPIEQIAESLNISISKANRLSNQVREKVDKVVKENKH